MATLNISEYLKSVVRSVSPDDVVIKTICLNAGIDEVDASFDDLSEKQQRLALAYLYLWLGTGPTTGTKWSEKDGDWSQSGSEGTFTRGQLWMYLRMARDILAEYGIDAGITPLWGFRGGGFRNVRRGYNGRLE
jgi:hypothetical protein